MLMVPRSIPAFRQEYSPESQVSATKSEATPEVLRPKSRPQDDNSDETTEGKTGSDSLFSVTPCLRGELISP